MAGQKLTIRQWEALVEIQRRMDLRGPTVRELAKALGVRSSCTAFGLVERLIRAGYVRKLDGSRGIVLTGLGEGAVETGPRAKAEREPSRQALPARSEPDPSEPVGLLADRTWLPGTRALRGRRIA